MSRNRPFSLNRGLIIANVLALVVLLILTIIPKIQPESDDGLFGKNTGLGNLYRTRAIQERRVSELLLASDTVPVSRVFIASRGVYLLEFKQPIVDGVAEMLFIEAAQAGYFPDYTYLKVTLDKIITDANVEQPFLKIHTHEEILFLLLGDKDRLVVNATLYLPSTIETPRELNKLWGSVDFTTTSVSGI